jgi:hypothetical protein
LLYNSTLVNSMQADKAKQRLDAVIALIREVMCNSLSVDADKFFLSNSLPLAQLRRGTHDSGSGRKSETFARSA